MSSPSENAQRRITRLRQRGQLLKIVRLFFEQHGYWELETPLLSHESCIDRWLDPFPVQVGKQTCYLQTSPEFAMKRLLCHGADSIFQICKALRSGESGERHNPEFTMIEWYRQNISLAQQISFVEELITDVLEFCRTELHIKSRFSTPLKFHRLSYTEAFEKYAGLSPLTAELDALRKCAVQLSLQKASSSVADRDELLNWILAEAVEPELAKLGAVSIFDFPASQAALAKVRFGEVPVAERFELYLNGVEICNGYQELTDAVELRRRMEAQNLLRRAEGKPEIPVNSDLLCTMEQTPLPECSGVALGFDRLAMFCLGTETIRDVLAFPFDTDLQRRLEF